jgi:hypothetical protein
VCVGCTDNDNDGYFAGDGNCGPVDCNDNNPTVHPGAAEVCNGIDDNCDEQIDVGCVSSNAGVIIFKPTGGLNDGTDDGSICKGIDSGTYYADPDLSAYPFIFVDNSNCNVGTMRSFFQYDVTSLPVNVQKVELILHQRVYTHGDGIPWPISPTFNLRRITGSWNEKTITYPQDVSFDPLILDSHYIQTAHCGPAACVEFDGYLSYDITDAYRGWTNGTYTNYGLRLTIDDSYCPNGDATSAWTSDNNVNITDRPYLKITTGNLSFSCQDSDNDGFSVEGGICGPIDCNDNNAFIHPCANEVCNGVDDNCDTNIDEGCGNPAPVPAGLVSWWPGDGNANDIWDSNNGVLLNGATYAAGKVGQAFSFDGADDIVQVASPGANLNIANTLTLDAWIYPTTSGAFKNIIATDGPSNAYFLALYNLVPTVYFGGISNPGWYTATGAIPLNQWSHIAVTYDGSQIKFYINGVLDTTITGLSGNINSLTGPFEIGSRSAYPEYSFAGSIDEVDVFNVVLSQAQIQSIYNAGSAGKSKPMCTDNDNDEYSAVGGSCGLIDCNDNDAAINPGATEVCDGVDNDCDGNIDEGLTSRQTTCGLGVCSGNTGTETCAKGEWVGNTCDPLKGAATNDVCDGKDNDCDGQIDEEYVADISCFKPGVCAAGNMPSNCVNGVETLCRTGALGPREICDSEMLDEDCDGSENEGCTGECYEGNTKNCGPETETGECRFGTQSCSSNGAWGLCLGAVYPANEICDDGKDNNCNGQIDEGCGARASLENVLKTLQGLQSPNSNTNKELNKSIEHLQKVLYSDKISWLDGSHLACKHGNSAFDELKGAVESLSKIGDPKEKDKYDPNLKPVVDDSITKILDASRILATTLVSEATQATKKDVKSLQEANQALIKGDEARAKGDYNKALDEYKKAWQSAKAATYQDLGCSYCNLDWSDNTPAC